MHRDIKPGNIFVVGGAAKLGDYGLIAEIGESCDSRGTEGFQPLEGGADSGIDLYAIGKVIYEIWTGCDRLEFPSLPKRVLESDEWMSSGIALNKTMLKACHRDRRFRFSSAEEFREELLQIQEGTRPNLTRRRWIGSAVAGGAVASVGSFSILRSRHLRRESGFVAHWQLLKPWKSIPHLWSQKLIHVDSVDGVIYSLLCTKGGGMIYSITIEGLELKATPIVADFDEEPASGWIVHPMERTLWRTASGHGQLWRLNPRNGQVSVVGGTGPTDTDFANSAYWNPVSQRFGVMGGYGHYNMHNWRWEFDQSHGEWIEVEMNQPKREPWCRASQWLLPDNRKPRMYLFGGDGNETGKQGDSNPGFNFFDGHFYRLGDLWSLDFTNNQWTNIVPLPGIQTRSPAVAAYFSPMEAIVLLDRCLKESPYPTPPRMYLLRPEFDKSFLEMSLTGTVPDSRFSSFLCFDPVAQRMLSFMEDGIYQVNIKNG